MEKVKLDIYPIFPSMEYLHETFPIVPANKFLPEWYKKQTNVLRGGKMKSHLMDKVVIPAKKCPAIQEIISDGFIIPAWCDTYIYKDGNEFRWRSSLGSKHWIHTEEAGFNLDSWEWVQGQGESQIEGMGLNAIPNYGVLKLISPYYFVTPKGYGIEFTDPFYHHRGNVRLLPGKCETDIWHQVNFPFEFLEDISDEEEKLIFIKAGEPLVHGRIYKKDNYILPDISLNKHNIDFKNTINKQEVTLASVSETWNDYKKLVTDKD